MQVHRDLNRLPVFRRPVVTIGSFDGVHLGHRALLRRIIALAESVGGESVVVTFDPHPRHVLPSKRPDVKLLTDTLEKITRLEPLGIDHVVIVPFTLEFAAQTAKEYLTDFLLGRFSPHTVVIGYDHRFGTKRTGDIELLRSVASAKGVAVEEIAARDIDAIAVSSTRIRESVTAGTIEEANLMLGAPYELNGLVVHGDAIGRTIGFPTANLALRDAHKLIPCDGVYAVRASAATSADRIVDRPAMLYIGRRPSLAGLRARSIEINILDFDGDLYGSSMRVELVAHIREDAQFDGLDALRAQLERDRESTRSMLAE